MNNIAKIGSSGAPIEALSLGSDVEPRLVDLFCRIQQQTGIQFARASFAEQQLASMPGGAMAADGRLILGQGAATAPANFFRDVAQLGVQMTAELPASAVRHDGRPILCGKGRIHDGLKFVLEIGLTNIVQPDRPSFSMSVASSSGFTLQELEAIISTADPRWTMLMSGGPDLTFLSEPNARLNLAPQSFDECLQVINRLMQFAERAGNRLT